MKTNIEDAKEYEQLRHRYEGQMNGSLILRDFYINAAFKEGLRQKEIANALGLSESRIKHIIAKQKKAK